MMIHMIIACCLLIASIAQELAVIDATSEAKQFTRRIVSGTYEMRFPSLLVIDGFNSSGGPSNTIIRSGGLPVQLQALAHDSRVKTGGSLLVDFVITNNGQQPITLPISFDPRTVEPNWPTSRSFKYLSLYVATNKSVLEGGVSLYGAPDAAGTMITLLPSQSIRVHTRFFLGVSGGSMLATTQVLKASVLLNNVTLRVKGADAESASKEIGNVTSSEWTITVEN